MPQARSEGPLVERISRETIRSLLNPDPLCIGIDGTVRDALAGMRATRSSCVLVCEGKRLAGIFTERDYLDRIAGAPELLDRPVDEFMSADPRTLAPDHTLGELLRIIVDGGYRHLPVVEGDELRGIVAAQDIVKYIADLFPDEVYNLPPELDQVMPRVEGG